MNNITFVISCPYYDSGIKSLGSKCIYTIKKHTILEKQYKIISKLFETKNYEIIFVNNIDHNKTSKFLEKKKLDMRYVYLNKKNINHAGCFLKGLSLAKHDTIVNIDCGLVVSRQAILDTLSDDSCDINIGCVGNKHKQNQDLEIGCIVQHDRTVNNIFFGLDNKCVGLTKINSNAKEFILNNFTLDHDKNKYLFEIINGCISKNITCKKIDIKSKDAHLIFNKKSLQQYIG